MDGFVKAKVETNKGDIIELEYNTWGDADIYSTEDFNPSQRFLDELETGDQLVEAMREWFLKALDYTDRAKDLVEDNADAVKIRGLSRCDIKKINISSVLNLEWEVYGSDIIYNLDTHKRSRKNTGYSVE